MLDDAALTIFLHCQSLGSRWHQLAYEQVSRPLDNVALELHRFVHVLGSIWHQLLSAQSTCLWTLTSALSVVLNH